MATLKGCGSAHSMDNVVAVLASKQERFQSAPAPLRTS